MTVRIDRDPEFWLDVISDPDVATRMGGMVDRDHLVMLLSKPSVLPFASANGGYILSYLDALKRVAELHTMFKPAGWGREAFDTAREMFNHLFADGCALVITYETEANSKSRPPLTFGFKAIGEFEPSIVGPIKTWILQRPDWRASPAGKLS